MISEKDSSAADNNFRNKYFRKKNKLKWIPKSISKRFGLSGIENRCKYIKHNQKRCRTLILPNETLCKFHLLNNDSLRCCGINKYYMRCNKNIPKSSIYCEVHKKIFKGNKLNQNDSIIETNHVNTMKSSESVNSTNELANIVGSLDDEILPFTNFSNNKEKRLIMERKKRLESSKKNNNNINSSIKANNTKVHKSTRKRKEKKRKENNNQIKNKRKINKSYSVDGINILGTTENNDLSLIVENKIRKKQKIEHSNTTITSAPDTSYFGYQPQFNNCTNPTNESPINITTKNQQQENNSNKLLLFSRVSNIFDDLGWTSNDDDK